MCVPVCVYGKERHFITWYGIGFRSGKLPKRVPNILELVEVVYVAGAISGFCGVAGVLRSSGGSAGRKGSNKKPQKLVPNQICMQLHWHRQNVSPTVCFEDVCDELGSARNTTQTEKHFASFRPHGRDELELVYAAV